MTNLGMLIGLIAGLLLLFFWLSQWFKLMALSDDAFPGRHDKLIWAGLLLLGSVFGALVFWCWRAQKWLDRESDQMAADLGRAIRKAQRSG